MSQIDDVSSGSDSGSLEQETSPQGNNDSGGSLLTQQDQESADVQGEKPEDTGNDEPEKQESDADAQDPSTLVPAKPEEYKLDFGEDVQVDAALLHSFKETAHELGIPQGQAQKIADFYAKHTAEAAKTAQDAQTAAMAQAKQGWEKEITARPGFKQEVNDARRTLKEFGSPELNEIMDTSLLGSHPVFFEFIVNVGKALAEPDSRGDGVRGERNTPLVDRLWPNMK